MRIIEIVLWIFFLVIIMTMWVNILWTNNQKIANYVDLLKNQALNISLTNWSNYFMSTLTGSPPYSIVVNWEVKYLWTWYIIFKDYNFLTSTNLESELLYNCRLEDYKMPWWVLTVTWVFCRFYTNDTVFYNYRYY